MPVDLALMGVVAPAGSHELVLRYHSTWFRTGALISLLSWLGVLVWLYLGPIRRIGKSLAYARGSDRSRAQGAPRWERLYGRTRFIACKTARNALNWRYG